jgi:cytochrome oxidase Cu insertion factor (SCO1/SenC/PrrC family)
MFLTGTHLEISSLATNSLKIFGIENKPEERQSAADLFLHSTTFVIVDKHAQLRGVFETTGEDIDPAKAKGKILAAIRRLAREQ